MRCQHCNGTGVEPGVSIQSVKDLERILRKPTGKTYKAKGRTEIAVHEVYATAAGGWAITYGGGDVPAAVVREAIRRGVIADRYAGQFEGAYPGVGYGLPEHIPTPKVRS